MGYSTVGSPPQVRGKPSSIPCSTARIRSTPARAGKTFQLIYKVTVALDHPRRCGENCNITSTTAGTNGITPAGAGKTQACYCRYAPALDHPRRCGENLADSRAMSAPEGSPPQVRGKPSSVSAAVRALRITPAGAGKTRHMGRIYLADEDHPRRCGENGSNTKATKEAQGSPPQVRGKPVHGNRVNRAVGITPAGAGKTQVLANGGNTDEDHPRRCGENFAFAVKVVGVSGSPPQVRGKHKNISKFVQKAGITPAGAGKTLLFFGGQCVVRDHPRRCGENSTTCDKLTFPAGSPPQVRGKPAAWRKGFATDRITPAGAGKTGRVLRISRVRWDHPRRCGENPAPEHLRDRCEGSPPQVRGKPPRISAAL